MPLAAWSHEPEKLFRKWLAVHHAMGQAAYLVFATLNSTPAFIENRFLNLTTFAEAYHRIRHDMPSVAPKEHAEAVEVMLAALSERKLRNHYGPRLRYAGEQGFRSRMKALFRRAEEVVGEVKGWRTGGLPDRLIETRNSLTHGAGVDGNVLEGADLLWSIKRLLVVLQVNLLLDLEMPGDAVAMCIAQKYRLNDRLFDPI